MGVELIVKAVGMSPISNVAAIALRETHGQRCLLITVGQFEAMFLVSVKATHPRPTTYDLILEVITALGGRIVQVLIYKCEQDIFYARLVLDVGGRQIEFDCHPSDAIVLAVQVDAPIFAEETLFEKYSIIVSIEESEEESEKGITREQLGPFREIL